MLPSKAQLKAHLANVLRRSHIASSQHVAPLEARDCLEWCYRLKPAHELPLLDLSVSLKSHFLSANGLARFDRDVANPLIFIDVFLEMLLSLHGSSTAT